MEGAFLLVAVVIVACAIFVLVTLQKGRGFTAHDAPWDHPRVVDDVLTPEECRYIIAQAEPKFTRSTVVGKTDPDASRTSQTAWIPKSDPVAQKIFAKALEFSGKSIDNCEDLQIVKYVPGSFYREHHDSCCDGSQGCLDFEKEGGQRVATLLVYLNDEFTDGETHFPNLDLKLKAPIGSAILFRPMGRDECKCHPKALHAGLPPSTGIKYVCNAWVRENKFRS
jgi:prolyl 4-hydroxylase